jgi:hypothetical protein
VLPAIEGELGDADQGREVTGGQAAALPGVQDEQTLLWCQGRRRRGGCTASLWTAAQLASKANGVILGGNVEDMNGLIFFRKPFVRLVLFLAPV